MIEALLKTLELKDEKRTGWQLRKVEEPESVAGHSWGTAFLTIVHGEKEGIDTEKALKIAVVHDIGEAEIGDIAHRAVEAEEEISSEEKAEMEEKTVKKIASKIDGNILELWEEYEERNTAETQFVKDMDMIDMCLQALKYEKEERYDSEEENENFQEYENMDEFFATTKPRLNTETGKQLFQDIKTRYEEVKQE